MEYSPLILSLKLALVTTICLVIIGVPLAHWITYSKNRMKVVVESIVSLPLVLPPTVLGFYLLLLLSPNSLIGGFLLNELGLRMVFSFEGLVFGSVIYSLPFMVQPLRTGMSSLPLSLIESSQLLKKGKFQTLIKVILPSIKASVISGTVLSFAHTIGEFGVILMIGGNIPNKTRVASIAIYDQVEALNYSMANQYAIVLLIISFLVLLITYGFNYRSSNRLLR